LYIEYLYTDGQIDDKIFSFYMTTGDDSVDTFVDIGYMDESKFKGGSASAAGLVWIEMPTYVDILFWFAKTSALRFGEPSDDDSAFNFDGPTEYTFDNYIPAIFDTGTPLAMIPNTIAADFFGRLLHGQRYVLAAGMYQISCENKDEF